MDRSELETGVGSVTRVDGWTQTEEWPAPSEAMLNGDPLFDAIWARIKAWDIAVPTAYSGYEGATGNHVRAIYDAVMGITRGA